MKHILLMVKVNLADEKTTAFSIDEITDDTIFNEAVLKHELDIILLIRAIEGLSAAYLAGKSQVN